MQKIAFAMRTMIHPFDSFWDMKFEKKGSLKAAVFIYVLYFLIKLFDRQVRGFIFNPSYNTPIDFWYELRMWILPVLIFVLANWSVTTLMDGKGTSRDIFMVVAYSLLPVLLLKIPGAIISNYMSFGEAVYLNAIDSAGMIWFGILLFIGIMTVHQYSFTKTVVTFALTACSAAVMVFIALLFISLFQEIAGFIYSIYRELTLRI